MISGFFGKHRKVLVAGGAGFLGSRLCDAFVKGGHHVLCVDNFFTGSKANIVHLLGHPRFQRVRHDVTPAQAELGWSLGFGLGDGVPLTIEYFRKAADAT